MTTTPSIQLRRDGAVAYLRFNRPQVLNLIDADMTTQLLAACRELAVDTSLRASVLSGKAKASWPGATLPPRRGSDALSADERVSSGNECPFLKLNGFSLPMHKTGRQKASRCIPPAGAALSTARQRYFQMSLTLIYVSSIRQLPPTGRLCLWNTFSSNGRNRIAQQLIEECSTNTPRSCIISSRWR